MKSQYNIFILFYSSITKKTFLITVRSTQDLFHDCRVSVLNVSWEMFCVLFGNCKFDNETEDSCHTPVVCADRGSLPICRLSHSRYKGSRHLHLRTTRRRYYNNSSSYSPQTLTYRIWDLIRLVLENNWPLDSKDNKYNT